MLRRGLLLLCAASVAACGTGAGAYTITRKGSPGEDSGTGGVDAGWETGALDLGTPDTGCPPDPFHPSTTASVGTVTFVVTNTSGADRYVVTQGQSCDPLAIAGEAVSLPHTCICDCTNPAVPSFTLTPVSAGHSTAVTWDGRHLVPWMAYVSCSGLGGLPPTCAFVPSGALQPIPASPQTVSIAYATQVTPGAASGCQVVAGGFVCSKATTDTQCGTGAGDAPALQLVTQSFIVPASGDSTVQVSIP
jgi:hypothetical protein